MKPNKMPSSLTRWGDKILHAVAAIWRTLNNWISGSDKEEVINEKTRLTAALKQARVDLAWAQQCFNTVTDHNLTDYYIYQMLASEARYSHCLKQAKQLKEKPGKSSFIAPAAAG